MKELMHNTMYRVCNSSHELVLSLRCTPVCAEMSQYFSIPAAQLAIGRIIAIITEYQLQMKAAATAIRKRARYVVWRLESFTCVVRKVRVCAMRL